MKTKFSGILTLLLAFVVQFTFAQEKAISGTVTDDKGLPLPGVNVIVKNTANGTQTDFDGKYTIQATQGAVLSFSYVGFDSKDVVVGDGNSINLQLSASASELEEVVITAQGLKRGKKAIGYALQQVDSEDIIESGSTNAVDALVGKAAGIQITRSSGSAGGGSRILVRGVTSLIGNNQPLIVIDGVRTNNETLSTEGNTAGTAQSNRLMDLNTEDIKSLTVLKGAAATALYGTAGSTGVIVIETKKGNKDQRFSIDFTSQTTIDQVTSVFDLQNIFAQGSGGTYADPSTGASGSWGPRISDLEYSTNSSHPNAPGASAFDSNGRYLYDPNGFLVPRGTGNGQAANTYDNVGDFFTTAVSTLHSLGVQGGAENSSYRFSTSYLDGEGVVPNELYDRFTASLAGDLQATEKLSFSTTLNYAKSDFQRVQQGSNTSGLLLGLLRTPASFDNSGGYGRDAVDTPAAYIFSNGNQRNYRGGGGYDNPYWTVNNTLRDEEVNRVYGSFKLNYQAHPWLNVGFNVGTDYTNDRRKQNFEINSRTQSSGQVIKDEFNTSIIDSYLNLTGSGEITTDFTLNYLVGANLFSFKRSRLNVSGTNLLFQNFLDLSNATDVTSFETLTRYRTLGVFGQIEFGWKDAIFITATGRNDWDTRLAGTGDNFDLGSLSFFYPSVSSSIVFSEFLPENDILTLGKLRGSWAQVGAPPPFAYLTSTSFEVDPIGDGWGNANSFPIVGQTGFELDNVRGNSSLTPEISETIEVGADLRFFNDRFGIDFTYYKRKTKDAILNASLPSSTGSTNVWLNAGRLTSDGIELVVDGTPVRNDNFTWNTQFNFTKSESVVDELAPGLERLFLAGFNSAGTYLVAGNPYGAIFGGAYLREGAGGANDDGLNIPSGSVVINDDPTSSEYGYQAVDPTQRSIGNPNPDFILGWKNSFSYKRINFSFLLDWRQGGDLWNGTAWALSFFGRSQITAETRQEAPAPIQGVLSDGSANNIPVVRDQSYWQSSLGGFGAVGEQFVQDGGWIRLREVGLSYSFPEKMFGGKFVKGGSIGVTGRNLWFTSDYEGIDPETSLTGTGNGQGFDYFNMPSTKSVIFKLSLKF
ncbi:MULTISPECIES: SusC/RagA family TonB-linked outer membrane protein [Aquimarina]|uniref:SusC/RagA family TonB-linked outer membrane protein n=1 Tax=Aquimarina TaxID=290174 RepID=UPI00094436AA|nr:MULTISPECIES: SusC/RagA family TonB-linked outer membrane protein [Aquimarina]